MQKAKPRTVRRKLESVRLVLVNKARAEMDVGSERSL